jgi:hypothetical protein
VREIAENEYENQPSGLDGDDDCGQMSAWYIFTALGFYPVNPASGDYMIGSPLFTRATLQLSHSRHFTVIAQNNSAINLYIQSATLNGKPLTSSVLHYRDITQGATLRFVMGAKPSSWASSWKPSLSNEPLRPMLRQSEKGKHMLGNPIFERSLFRRLLLTRLSLATALILFATPTTVRAQQHPNLSGTWKLNLATSDSGDLQGPDTRTDVIEQHDGRISESVTAEGRHRRQQYTLDFATDGTQTTLPPGIKMGPPPFSAYRPAGKAPLW